MESFDIADFAGKLIIYMVVWLFAVTVHEAAHAWMSLKFGDETAYRLGRVTLNPIAHIDPLGTLFLPLVGFISSYIPGAAGVPLIMWGKPTPVNPLNWRRKDLANVMVSFAGIGTNIVVAIASSILIKLIIYTGNLTRVDMGEGLMAPVFTFLYSTLILNVGLAVFNLIPIPPLDGGRALESFLPLRLSSIYQMLETYGFLILFVLIYLGVIGWVAAPLNNFIIGLLF